MITVVHLKKGNRMIRTGLGQHEGRWFGRVDLWWSGLRFTGWHLLEYLFVHALLLYWIFS